MSKKVLLVSEKEEVNPLIGIILGILGYKNQDSHKKADHSSFSVIEAAKKGGNPYNLVVLVDAVDEANYLRNSDLIRDGNKYVTACLSIANLEKPDFAQGLASLPYNKLHNFSRAIATAYIAADMHKPDEITLDSTLGKLLHDGSLIRAKPVDSKYSALIIDDSRLQRDSFAKMADDMGYRTETASTGGEGLYMILDRISNQGSPYELIVCNQTMWMLHGLTVHEFLKKQDLLYDAKGQQMSAFFFTTTTDDGRNLLQPIAPVLYGVNPDKNDFKTAVVQAYGHMEMPQLIKNNIS
ncbi:MAG: hypothetical protein ABIJ08_03370 [Nanoarchaeota archaeon]